MYGRDGGGFFFFWGGGEGDDWKFWFSLKIRRKKILMTMHVRTTF